MNWKKFGKNLLYPPLWVIITLVPLSTTFLIYALVFIDETNIISIISYLIAFYTLTIISVRIPNFIKSLKRLKNENKYINKFTTDVHFRMNLSLYGSLIFNIAFAIFQLGLGIYHNSLWFFSMFAYYIILSVLRFLILSYTKNYKPSEQIYSEIKRYYLCGWMLLALNLALSIIIVFVVLQNKTFYHHEIITIALASYTFFTFTFAIINRIKYKKYNSPVYTSAKNISLVTASVSILTLESTMLTTFGGEVSGKTSQIMLIFTGGAIIILAITIALSMIIKGKSKLKSLNASSKDNINSNSDDNEINLS